MFSFGRHQERFIPAGAGNMHSPASCSRSRPVHPRGCGEHNTKGGDIVLDSGSSPRVRGTWKTIRRKNHILRFIPAGAGNIQCSAGSHTADAVHPRGCGEHAGRLASRNSCARFIPAGAGNISAVYALKFRRAVHPRGCGEHASRSRLVIPSAGSSPRVRGTSRIDPVRGVMLRFIPAGAGNIQHHCSQVFAWSVHPRGCGEHTSAPFSTRNMIGSSPRVRGTCLVSMIWRMTYRFIPAGAGNM